MRLNHTLGELNNNDFEEYGEWLYWITIMGKPSGKEPWGWQLDGHHLIVNYFVLGDQVVMTPPFVGSEPVIAEAANSRAQLSCRTSRDLAWHFVHPFRRPSAPKPSRTLKGRQQQSHRAWKDNVVLDYAGVRAADVDASAFALLSLIDMYIANMDDGHAR